ncbi:FAD-binding oxidoreductase [Paenibacillus thalictri]|uniref:FAD-binding oxidoreductase n=1 Tax=Paenibacillus thalictri TaxID=2527873 RepID=A0A4Q9DHT5_9BACL|nr:FAD-binding oxidoreductase [Paenibacillus thalictri]TBL70749.1 FAD-binding oxidoreductase [Paenibacillus thalictri]
MSTWLGEMESLIGERFITSEAEREKLSKDYFWYSPVLDRKLKDKVADGIAAVKSEEDVRAVLAFAYKNNVPVTARGAGTGNYGQAVPLEKGIVLDLSGLDTILEIGDGYARVQAGVKLGTIEKTARAQGQELRIYPSTYMVATAGGFVCGGSGGIGSITWGTLWDGNVLEATVYTLEDQPRKLVISGEELARYIHNYGTTGVVTELKIPLAPRQDWLQTVYHFDTLEQAARFAEAVSKDDSVLKRLVSVMEWPIPAYFTPLKKVLEKDAAAVLLETVDGTIPALNGLAEPFGGRLGHTIEAASYKKGVSLSDFTWNHTTLWGLKSDPTITYIQASFSGTEYMEQINTIKEKFGDEVIIHLEWMKARGRIAPGSIPIIRFTTEERLNEIIQFFEATGVPVSNPHTWLLDDGGKGRADAMRLSKMSNDPRNLLNPGKIRLQAQ